MKSSKVCKCQYFILKNNHLFLFISEFADLSESERDTNAMEVVAGQLKQSGKYISRQLSFKNAIHVEKVSPTPKFCIVYDSSVKMWIKVLKAFNEAADLVNATAKIRKSMVMTYWTAHLRFFNQLRISAKVLAAAKIATDAVNNGNCVVIGLDSTGEARTLEAANEGEVSHFISTAKGVLYALVEKNFPGSRSSSSSSLQNDQRDCGNGK